MQSSVRQMIDGVMDVGAVSPVNTASYIAAFTGGHQLNLLDRSDTFRVSQAGLALGDLLVQNITQSERAGRVLDLGTGSGVLAMLLRRLGAVDITATDICTQSVATAARNELLNFDSSTIVFTHGDPFPANHFEAERKRYDLIVFNPPGWRTPSTDLSHALLSGDSSLNLSAMFFGDEVIVRFLADLPTQLASGGRAIIGLNSLVGIDDVRRRAQNLHSARGGPILQFKQLALLELPLLYYTKEWADSSPLLTANFESWRAEHGSQYSVVDDVIRWEYQITEVTLGPACT